MSEVLALEGKSPTSDWNDALAYVDALSDAQREKAEALIRHECAKMRSEGPSADHSMQNLPDASRYLLFQNNTIMKGEMSRIESGTRNMPPLDTSRTALDTPRLHSQGDPAAWRTSADNAATQLEHQYHRIENFKLGLKFGPAVWKSHNARTDMLVAASEKRLRDVEARITKVNQRRKLQQDRARLQLQRLQSAYAELVGKNLQITLACDKLDEELSQAASASNLQCHQDPVAPGD